MEREAPGGRPGVDRVAQRAQGGTTPGQQLDQLHEVHQRAGQAVEAHDDQGIAGGDASEQSDQRRAVLIGA